MPHLKRPTLCLQNFDTSALAATRPVPLRQKDEEELTGIASDDSFWVRARDRGEVSHDSLLDLKHQPHAIAVLVSYAVVQLVRVSLRADYGAAMRTGAFNEAKIYSRANYEVALIGALRVTRRCNWVPYILPAAPAREPEPLPFGPFKRRDPDEPLHRARRTSSTSSGSSSTLQSISEYSENDLIDVDMDVTIRRSCDQLRGVPEHVFTD